MPRVIKELTDIEIDEVSLVDRPANQHARVAIAKRATEEDNVPEVFNEDGDAIDMDSLDFGDVVFDEEGNAFEVVADEAEEFEYADEYEPVGKSLADEIREDLAKAAGDSDRDFVVSKAAERIDALTDQLNRAELVAKSERDLRLTSEYVEVAKSYNLPVAAEDLGPVLMRMAEEMSDDDCAVIHKSLIAAGSALYDEVGFIGSEMTPLDEAEAYANSYIGKSDTGENISKADAVSEFYSINPAAYDEYLATRRGF